MKNEKPRGCKAPGFLINSFAFTLGVAPLTRLTFFIAEKDPAGRTLQAAPCGRHPAGRLCKKLAPRVAVRRTNLFLSGHFTTFLSGVAPLTRLTFFIAKKVSKKASPLGTYKTYFEPGVLQLPTVKQIKRLYNSVQNRFYKQVQKGALNSKQQQLNGTQQQQTATAKARRKTALCFMPCRAVQELVLVA